VVVSQLINGATIAKRCHLILDLLLAENEQPSFSFEGDVEGLRKEFMGKFQALIEKLGEQTFLIVTGHPGSGKSTLLRALSATVKDPLFRVFHIDDFVDWGKVIPHVQTTYSESKWDENYLPVANKAALGFLRESLGDEKLVLIEGSGLIDDYLRIFKELRLPSPSFVLLHGSYEVFTARLTARGDDLQTKEKEIKEHQENLKTIQRVRGLIINTDETKKHKPLSELSAILALLEN
jgi:adenylate kinase family enzyme